MKKLIFFGTSFCFLFISCQKNTNTVGKNLSLSNKGFTLATSYEELKNKIKTIIYGKNNNQPIDFEINDIKWNVKDDKFGAEILYTDQKGRNSNLFYSNTVPSSVTSSSVYYQNLPTSNSVNPLTGQCYVYSCRNGSCCHVAWCDPPNGPLACNCNYTDCFLGGGCQLVIQTVNCD